MSIETYLSYLVVVLVFFATPPDTSQLLIISNSLRHGVKKSMATVAGDLSANTIQMTAAAFGLAAAISVSTSVLSNDAAAERCMSSTRSMASRSSTYPA